MGTSQYIIFVLVFIIVPKTEFVNGIDYDSNGPLYETRTGVKDDILDNGDSRDPKFSIFQIIKFSNEPCIGSTRNGTCFTKQECENAGGTESGSCADGFGICCTIVLSDGGTTSLNQSYIVQSSSTSLGTGSRQYTICPCSSDVCRIKFDFTTFNLAAPYTAAAGTAAGAQIAVAVGDCQIDTFSITSPGYAGSPIICGTNANQHMIMDVDGTSCSKVNIGLGNGAGTTAREWDIMVTQYRCGEEDGGPPGCLQWHTSSTGSVRSFNFPNQSRGTAVGSGVTHLSSQEYEICIRTPAGANHICYVPCTDVTPTATIAQQAFGLSIGPNAAAQSAFDTTHCEQDYIRITGATSQAIAQAGTTVAVALLCGRSFETASGVALIANADTSVCTSSQPFRIGVHFDADEFPTNADLTMDDTNATDGEFLTTPGGIIGFSLCYATGTPSSG